MPKSLGISYMAICAVIAFVPPAFAQSAYDDVPELIDPATCDAPREGWSERALARSLNPPLGLPPLPHPADNPPSAAKIELGLSLIHI